MPEKKNNTKNSHDINDRNTQWHMAVAPAIRLELMEYGDILDYIPERLLNTKSLQIDLLVIKKSGTTVIENEIGKIFKRSNIIEYKSPHDSEGVNEYFKAYAYASLYKISESGTSGNPEEITITMIRRGKPYKLFKWFEAHACTVRKRYDGVYYIENAGFFETQVIVGKELNDENHIWLKSLTDRLDREQAKELIRQSGKLLDRPESDYAESVLQVVSKANRKVFEELKKEDGDMYSALVELMQPEIDEATEKVRNETWDEASAKKTLEAVDNAMKKLHMSFEEACAFMDITPAQHETYMQVVKTLEEKRQRR
ncbi:MAG: hypothetical protein K2N90_07745 [Lachnospiraceae bacterium]|nr:hypothetical protein [Lachnospiraceae bacterium]